jgi:hypothetical protein
MTASPTIIIPAVTREAAHIRRRARCTRERSARVIALNAGIVRRSCRRGSRRHQRLGTAA